MRVTTVIAVAVLLSLALAVAGCNRKPISLNPGDKPVVSNYWVVQSGDSVRMGYDASRLQLDSPFEIHWSVSELGPILLRVCLSFDDCGPQYGCGAWYRDCPNVEYNVAGAGRHGIAVSGLPGGRNYLLSVFYGTDLKAVIGCRWLDLSSRPDSGSTDSIVVTAL